MSWNTTRTIPTLSKHPCFPNVVVEDTVPQENCALLYKSLYMSKASPEKADTYFALITELSFAPIRMDNIIALFHKGRPMVLNSSNYYDSIAEHFNYFLPWIATCKRSKSFTQDPQTWLVSRLPVEYHRNQYLMADFPSSLS